MGDPARIFLLPFPPQPGSIVSFSRLSPRGLRVLRNSVGAGKARYFLA